MSQIYVIYRPEDSRKRSQEIISALQKLYGKSNITSPDYDSYVDVYQIEKQVKKTNYLIVVIGNYWADMVDEQGSNLLQSVYDPVHMAIATAIQSKKRIIPILTDGASMPRGARLPRELRPLTRLDSIQIGKNESASKKLNKGLKDIIKRSKFQQIPDIGKYLHVPNRKAQPHPRLRQPQRPSRDWKHRLTYGILPTIALAVIAFGMAFMLIPNKVSVSSTTTNSVEAVPEVVLATTVPISTATIMTQKESTITESPPIIATVERIPITIDNAGQLQPIASDAQNISLTEPLVFTEDGSLFIFVSKDLKEVQFINVATAEILRVIEFSPATPLFLALNPDETILYVIDSTNLTTWGIPTD